MEIVIGTLQAWLFGFVCALPFIWNERYIARMLQSAFAPLAFHLWLLWVFRGAWSAAFRDFEITGDLAPAMLGGLCAAQVKLVLARWGMETGSSHAITNRLRNLPAAAVALLSLMAAAIVTYLFMDWTWGGEFEWTTYFPIVVVAIGAAIYAAWYCCFETSPFVWTAALGGYLGSFAGAVHRDWDIITATISHHHYDYATEMLMLPEYFFYGGVGALAAGLMIGFSLIAAKLLGMWTVGPVAGAR